MPLRPEFPHRLSFPKPFAVSVFRSQPGGTDVKKLFIFLTICAALLDAGMIAICVLIAWGVQ
jgi:hypothetical protein